MDLKDKVVVITGGGRGLGKALAEAFAQEGVKLVLGARTETELRQTAESLEASFVAMNVTSEKEVHQLAQTAIQKHGRIDVWVNNAAIRMPWMPIEELDCNKVHELIEVNLFGTMYGSKEALICMKKQKSGAILNILSTIALKGEAQAAGYCASKYAATGFTKCLKLAAEPHNIQVISVYPGGMKTTFFSHNKPPNYDEYMEPSHVAEKIIANLKKDKPEEELVIKRPGTL